MNVFLFWDSPCIGNSGSRYEADNYGYLSENFIKTTER